MTVYSLQVCGKTWSGFKAVYTYKLLTKPIMTDDEAKAVAGDFESLTDWRLVSYTAECRRGRVSVTTTIIRKTLRGFRNGMTPRRFSLRLARDAPVIKELL